MKSSQRAHAFFLHDFIPFNYCEDVPSQSINHTDKSETEFLWQLFNISCQEDLVIGLRKAFHLEILGNIIMTMMYLI